MFYQIRYILYADRYLSTTSAASHSLDQVIYLYEKIMAERDSSVLNAWDCLNYVLYLCETRIRQKHTWAWTRSTRKTCGMG